VICQSARTVALGMTMMALVSLEGCSAATDVTQTPLNQISSKCGLNEDAIRVYGDRILFQPSADSKYEAVDCALGELKKLPGISDKLGFVGNERFVGNEQMETEAK